jgi:DNA-binding NarL/FixJ family response regulator
MLVADLRMPHMDGESLLKTVRSAGGEAELTIVLISGKLDPALESKLLREGADAVLPKALGPRILAQAAAAVMDRKRALGSK